MVVVITGASAGIGRGLALRYLALGAQVVAVARRHDKLAELSEAARNHNGELHPYVADVTDHAAMARLAQKVEANLGAADLVIANAGVAKRCSVPGLDAGASETTFATNVLGVVHTLDPFIGPMQRRGSGQLAVISSLAAIHCLPGLGTYCASKAALNRLLEGLYWDLRPYGIQVCTICPGFIDTNMTRGHKIPARWMMSLEVAVAKIGQALDRRHRVHYFPFELYAAVRLLALAPDWLKAPLLTNVVHRLFPQRTGEIS